MATSKELADKLMATVEAGRAKAKAEGYVPPDGTYTFTNKEAVALLGAINITQSLMEGDLKLAILMGATLLSAGDEGEAQAILKKIAGQLIDTQAPPYIVKAVDDTIAERNQTDVRLS